MRHIWREKKRLEIKLQYYSFISYQFTDLLQIISYKILDNILFKKYDLGIRYIATFFKIVFKYCHSSVNTAADWKNITIYYENIVIQD